MNVQVQIDALGDSVELISRLERQAKLTLTSVAPALEQVHIVVQIRAREGASGSRATIRGRLRTGEVMRASVSDESFLRAFLGSIAVFRRDVLRAGARAALETTPPKTAALETRL